jgi:hypothetical protein
MDADAPADVAPAVDESEAALSGQRVEAPQGASDRKLPVHTERACERLLRHPPTLERALGIGGHRHEGVDGRPRNDLDHEIGGLEGERLTAALLPHADDAASAGVVDHRRAGSREREAAARALRAACHRPGARRSTALADGGREKYELTPAPRTQGRPGARADRAAFGEEKLEQADLATVGRDPSHVGHGSVSDG